MKPLTTNISPSEHFSCFFLALERLVSFEFSNLVDQILNEKVLEDLQFT
jgi:hypothetical protein